MRGFNRTLATVFLAGLAAVSVGDAAHAAKFKVLNSFCCRQGSNPQAALIMDQNGNLFGTTPNGGSASKGTTGTAFELERRPSGGYKFKILFQFVHGGPSGPLILDVGGNLYGTVAPEGAAGGAIFMLSPSTDRKRWTETVLYRFCSQQNCTDGSAPTGGLTYAGASSGTPYDGSSPLYGVTEGGGANNGGTVFQLANKSGSWTETVLYSFCSIGAMNCLDGKVPHGGMILDSSGALYGTTFEGGGNNVGTDKNGAGIVFQLVSAGNNSWSETVLHRFCSMQRCADGANPEGELVLDASGRLLGTTLNGLSCKPDKLFGCGTVYQLQQAGSDWQETVLYTFCSVRGCKDGQSPEAGLTIDASGEVFGTTTFGGGNDTDLNGLGGGIAFRLSGSSYTILHRFCSQSNCADGEYPSSALVPDASGRLYGATSHGGANGDEGTVFRLDQ